MIPECITCEAFASSLIAGERWGECRLHSPRGDDGWPTVGERDGDGCLDHVPIKTGGPLTVPEPPVVTPVPVPPAVTPIDVVDYRVASDRDILALPWETLAPGSVVTIEAGTYHVKLLMPTGGKPGKPITLRGIGQPVFEADGAAQRPHKWYGDRLNPSQWTRPDNDDRFILAIGQRNRPDNWVGTFSAGGDPGARVGYVTIEGITFRGARQGATFLNWNQATGTHEGTTPYLPNAAGAWVVSGDGIAFDRCRFENCGDGLMVSSHRDVHSRIISVIRCAFVGNSYAGGDQHHNAYVEAEDVIFYGCWLYLPRDRVDANNLKIRAGGGGFGVSIIGCHIENGSRQIQICQPLSASLRALGLAPGVRIQCNLLIDGPDQQVQMIDFGGDVAASVAPYLTGEMRVEWNDFRSPHADPVWVRAVGGLVIARNNQLIAGGPQGAGSRWRADGGIIDGGRNQTGVMQPDGTVLLDAAPLIETTGLRPVISPPRAAGDAPRLRSEWTTMGCHEVPR